VVLVYKMSSFHCTAESFMMTLQLRERAQRNLNWPLANFRNQIFLVICCKTGTILWNEKISYGTLQWECYRKWLQATSVHHGFIKEAGARPRLQHACLWQDWLLIRPWTLRPHQGPRAALYSTLMWPQIETVVTEKSRIVNSLSPHKGDPELWL
jgi:hypothetical protein